MLNRRQILAALFALPLTLAGCEIDTINSFPTKAAHVRVVNAIPNTPSLDVKVDGTTTWPALPFEGMTGYSDFSNQTHTFSVTATGAITTLTQANFNLAGEASYTLIAFGPVEAPALLLLSDDTISPSSGRFLMRVANAAAGAATFDVYVTAPGAALDTLAPNLSSIAYGGSTGFLQLSSGTLQMRLTQAGTKAVIYDSGARTWSDNTATDAIVYTRSGGQLVNLALVDINGANQKAIVNSTLTDLKFVNAAFDTGSVNSLLDGTVVNSNIAYAAALGYNIVPPGAHTISFEATTTPGAIVASVATTLAAATDTSVFITGFAGAVRAVVLQDANFPAQNGNPRLRIVNASPDAPALDVLVNGTRQVSALAFPTASPYLSSISSGTYTITFNNPATGATVFTASGVALTGGQTSTLYLIGPAAQLSSLLTRDY
jgi:hypothetical protein